MPQATAPWSAAAERHRPEYTRPVPPTPPFGRDTIVSILPHRDPFLLLDEVLELEPGTRVSASYRVPEDGWWFAGHFP